MSAAAKIFQDIYPRVMAAVQPVLDRADRGVMELTTPEAQGKHRKDTP